MKYSHRFELLLSKEELDQLGKVARVVDRSRAYIVREALKMYFTEFKYGGICEGFRDEDDYRAGQPR